MAKDKKYRRMINYTSRDFNSIKRDLVEQARRYYPDSYRDFSESGFGSLMLDSTAYIGDMLSFYLDYNVNESFMDTAQEYNNIVRHAKQFGYKFEGRNTASGIIALFILVPASTSGMGLNTSYVPTLKRGSEFKAQGGGSFILAENVDFSNPKNQLIVARTDSTTGLPTFYAVKAYGRVISGRMASESISVAEYQPFRRIKLSGRDISEIISVVDSQGKEYYQVDFLSQDIIYREIVNRNVQNDNVQSILKPFSAARRFVAERERSFTYLQFGFGSDSEIADPSVVEPTNVILNMFGRDYITDTAFDPSKLTRTDKFGVTPSDTTLTISYRVVGSSDSNASAGAVTTVSRSDFEFPSVNATDSASRITVIDSLEVVNEESIVGSVSLPSKYELKRRAYDFFATQNRAVTKQDYEALVYNMDSKFGTVKRCNILRDNDSLKRNLNMYVISEDTREKLTTTNNTIKENLKTWLNKYRMMNDTIDILDAYIVNIGIDFTIVANEDKNKYDVLNACSNALVEKYKYHNYIGEPFYISEIYSTLNKVDGVSDVMKVKMTKKTGSNYSNTRFDLEENTSVDGRYIKVPENVVLEIKYLTNDIKGSVR